LFQTSHRKILPAEKWDEFAGYSQLKIIYGSHSQFLHCNLHSCLTSEAVYDLNRTEFIRIPGAFPITFEIEFCLVDGMQEAETN
jgi:hypothetical protein